MELLRIIFILLAYLAMKSVWYKDMVWPDNGILDEDAIQSSLYNQNGFSRIDDYKKNWFVNKFLYALGLEINDINVKVGES